MGAVPEMRYVIGNPAALQLLKIGLIFGGNAHSGKHVRLDWCFRSVKSGKQTGK